MSRRKIRMRGLVSRTEPTGKCLIAKSTYLRNKFRKGTITREELWELVQEDNCSDLIISGEVKMDTPVKNGKFKTVVIFSREMQISIEDHKVHNSLICL